MAQPKKRVPVPKTQSELTREQIVPYDSLKGAVPASSKANRENQISLKNDDVKLPVVGFKDIDGAIIYYFNNVIKPSVIQNGNKVDVPVLYGSPERWAAVQQGGFYRDKDGKIQVPLIMFKKSSIEKNRNLGNKLDGNEVNNFVIYEKKYSKRNIYDKFSVLTNRNPTKELYGVVVPDYVTITYQCVMFTDYVEQCDKLIEALNFASDSYWGDKERYRFRAMIDSYTPTVEVIQGQDRGVKATFNIKLNGYIITDTYNRDKANLKKFYSKSQLLFSTETVTDVNGTEVQSRSFENRGAVRFYDGQLNATQTVSQILAGMTAAEIVYVSLRNAAIADSKSGSTATFNNRTIATPPGGFAAITTKDFEVYINGRRVPDSQITSVTQVSTNIEVLLDVAGFFEQVGAVLEAADEVLLIGKFN
jgi:hypothetical protein